MTDPHAQFDLSPALEERLCRAAEDLVDAGCVSEVRVHQNGSIVTGIVRTEASTTSRGGTHRVYIRRVNGSAPLQAECSCGARGTCVHAAAVSIAAAHRRQGVAPAGQGTALPHAPREPRVGTGVHRERTAGQQLLYLLEAEALSALTRQPRRLRVTIWVSPTRGAGLEESSQAVAFAPRRTARTRGQYPRYVDECDEDILEILLADGSEGGSWWLQGQSGAQVLQRIAATGRAFWGSLQSPPLRAGSARRARLSWRIGENGDQHLACDAGDSAAVMLCLAPALYVDLAAFEWGSIELPCSADPVHRYADRTIAPEEIAALNAQLDSEEKATSFPRAVSLRVERRALSSLRARLCLVTGPRLWLQFLYNGVAVDGSQLSDERGRRALPSGAPLDRRTRGAVCSR